MTNLTHFQNIDELVRRLDKERTLLSEMFQKRKVLSLTQDMAEPLVDYNLSRIKLLIDYGVIHESGNFLELEAVYLQFFEEVLDVNEQISVASVQECITTLKEHIGYYLKEDNPQRKYQYLSAIRQLLRKTGLRTLRNVIDLKRNVDTAYKQEPNYAIKKQRLNDLDTKRESIALLIKECEKLLDTEKIFFSLSNDPQMARTVQDVRNDFNEAYHNLMEIGRQIIDYINLIDQQNLLAKKIRKLKYLRDQLTIKENTNILHLVGQKHDLWFENRPYSTMRLSIELLRSSEEMAALIRKVAQQKQVRQKQRSIAPPFVKEDLIAHQELLREVNQQEVWNAFSAAGKDLFSFVLCYDYKVQRTLADHVALFCELVARHPKECRITDSYKQYQTIEYPLIYAK